MSFFQLPNETLHQIWLSLTQREDLITFSLINHRFKSIRDACSLHLTNHWLSHHRIKLDPAGECLQHASPKVQATPLHVDAYRTFLRIHMPTGSKAISTAHHLLEAFGCQMTDVPGNHESGNKVLSTLCDYLGADAFSKSVDAGYASRLYEHWFSGREFADALRIARNMAGKVQPLPAEDVWKGREFQCLVEVGRVGEARDLAQERLGDLKGVSGVFGPLNEAWAVRLFECHEMKGQREEARSLAALMVEAGQELEGKGSVVVIGEWEERLSRDTARIRTGRAGEQDVDSGTGKSRWYKVR